MSVEDVLVQAGLPHLAPAFKGTSLERFKGLLIQDYDKYGIYDVVEKQALFKVIKGLNAEDLSLTLSPENSQSNLVSEANSSPEPLARYNIDQDADQDDLLDLDEDDDDDFLQTFSDAFAKNITPERLAGTLSLSASAAASSTNPPTAAAQASVGTPLNFNTNSPSPPPPSQNGSGLYRQQSTAASTGTANVPSPQTSGTQADLAALADPPRIRVIVRKRPLNKKEIERGDTDVLQCDSDNASLYVHEPKTKVDLTKYTESHVFCFDDVFDDDVDNDQVYKRAVRPLIATLFRAGKGTCFAYGQTGSGKTYTMGPLPLRAAADIFSVIEAVPEYRELSLHVACYEIYGGKVFDLLNNRQRLEVREDAKRRVQVVGLKEVEVKTMDVLLKICEHSAGSRSTGQTGANDESSRSHSIMVFSLRAPAPQAPTGPGIPQRRPLRAGQEPEAPVLKTIGKLSFIDLAGSERGADTYDNDKQTRLEGAEINKSLLALKECIRALDAEARHIPFRGSKLTEVLRDSFIGKNARTVMIANVSPNSSSCEHTLNTLRYADRVKEIKKDQANGAGGNKAINTSNSGDKTVLAEEVSAVAALLHKLPPPSIPTDNGGPSVQQQQQNANTNMNEGRRGVVAVNNGRNNAAAAPVSPTKMRTPARGSAALNGNNTTRNNNNNNVTPVQIGLPPIGAAAPSPAPHTAGQSGRAAPAPAAVTPQPPRRAGSLIAHPLHHSLSDASHSSAARSTGSANMVDEDILNPLLAAEEELIAAHRSHIETTMSTVKEEMELLSQLDESSGTAVGVEGYIEELSNILVEKAAAIAALQQQVTAFRRQMKAAAAAAAAGN